MAKTIYVMNAVDQETNLWAQRLLVNPSYDREVVKGGTEKLGGVNATTTLAIMAHGTAQLAVVVKEGDPRRWTPEELAKRLESDKLPKTHRVLELLICDAGASANTVEFAEKLEELRLQWKAEPEGAKKALLAKQYKDLEKAAPESLRPQAIDLGDNPQRVAQDYSNWTTKWLLPFGAALMQEMKKLNYEYLRVLSYKYEISAHFNQGKVWVADPAQKGDRLATDADLVQWL